jgi:hypothetical protein
LSPDFRRIRLVKPIKTFIIKAECHSAAMGEIEVTHDYIWIQWVIIFLTDDGCIVHPKKWNDHSTNAPSQAQAF